MDNTRPPTISEIEELTAFMPKLYAEGFKPVKQWHGGPQEGRMEITMPWPEYDPLVEDFFRTVGKNCWSDYDYIPEESGRMAGDPDFIKTSTMAQVKTMLTYCLRGERFSEGHWGVMIDNGTIRNLLEHLKELAALM
jgi:hypothetical protein